MDSPIMKTGHCGWKPVALSENAATQRGCDRVTVLVIDRSMRHDSDLPICTEHLVMYLMFYGPQRVEVIDAPATAHG